MVGDASDCLGEGTKMKQEKEKDSQNRRRLQEPRGNTSVSGHFEKKQERR